MLQMSPRRFAFHSLATVILLACSLVPAPLRAQGGGAVDLSNRGNTAFEAGNYKDAAVSYDLLLKNFPSSELASDTRFRLAYADFFLGQYDAAVDLLRKLIPAQTTAPELVEQASGLLPQVLSQQAAALKPGDAQRKAGFESALQEYTTYLQKFPKAAGVETALYGRAVAAYQIGSYDAAAKDLRASLAAFPNGDSALDTEFLLSVTLATQANLALGNENHPPAETTAAMSRYAESEKLLGDIIRKHTDLSLANEAQFQLGETLMAQAGSSPGASKDALYKQALAAYRAVEPKEPMVAAQQARLQAYTDALLAERRKGAQSNPAQARKLVELQGRESSKLAALKGRDDEVITARVKCGAAFFGLRQYDETRVLMNALAPEARKPEDEKYVLYYTALSYAAQNLVDKAVAAYDAFQAKHAGDAIAENLPLVIAGLFPSDPTKAEKYLGDLVKNYPESRLREMAMLQQAQVFSQQRKYADAVKTLDAFLQGNPKREYAAMAELARASALKDSKDLDGALANYKKVRDNYKDRPQAEEAGFWVASVELQKKDYAGAIAEDKTFQGQFPDSKLMPYALLVQAQAQGSSGAKDQALATLEDLGKRFADTKEAESSYFQRANLYISDKNYGDTAKVLTQFVDKYPESDELFAAYDRIASVQVQNKQTEAAAATYARFLDKKPEAAEAPVALGKLAALWQSAAKGMGSFISLGAPQQETWKADVANSIAASEQQLDKYPDAPATALGLESLLQCQQMLAAARVKKPEEVTQYFQGLADRYKDKPAARSRILFRLASITVLKDPAKALADMQAAYDPAVVYSPADIDQYGSALLTSDPAAAAAVYDKLARDYPLPAGVPPSQAPLDVQEAQSLALYGRAKVTEATDKAAAGKLYAELLATYPRSAKAPEAELGISESLIADKKWDDAMKQLNDVARAPSAPLFAKARALFLNGVVQEARGEVGALDSYLKVAAFYATAPDAPEGLWKGGQLLEKQAATLTDPNTKATQIARARKAYDDLVKRYPNAAWVTQAKDRLAALPAPTPGK